MHGQFCLTTPTDSGVGGGQAERQPTAGCGGGEGGGLHSSDRAAGAVRASEDQSGPLVTCTGNPCQSTGIVPRSVQPIYLYYLCR